MKAVYSELHNTLMSINEQDDLKWWKNNHGPSMPTDWPKIEVRGAARLRSAENPKERKRNVFAH